MVDTSRRQRPYGNDDIDALESRGRARQERVRAKKAAGKRPAAGESMDLADELDRIYDEGVAEGMKRGPKPRRPRPASSSSSSSAPTSSSSSSSSGAGVRGAFPMPTFGASLDRAQGRTMILVFSAFSAVIAVTRDTFQGTPPPAIQPATLASFGSSEAASSGAQLASSKGPAKPKEPVHLRAFAGVFVVGTIALALNEINPTFGVAMSGILLLEELLSIAAPGSAAKSTPAHGGSGGVRYVSTGNASLLDAIGGAVFNGSSTVTPPAAQRPQLASTPATPAQPPSGVHV